MSLDSSTELLHFIWEKEKRERRRRRLRWGIGVALFLGLGGGIWGYAYLQLEQRWRGEVFDLDRLTHQKVRELLDRSPEGVWVVDAQQGDTIRLQSLHQFSLLAAALGDQTVGGSPAEWESGAWAAQEAGPAISPVSNEARIREILQRVDREGPLTQADIMPAYPGGESGLRRFLSQQVRYPQEAARQQIQGTVYLRFVIDEEGQVTQPEVMQGIGYGCDAEALRVLRHMPDWIPGEIEGVKVPVFTTLAINFRFL